MNPNNGCGKEKRRAAFNSGPTVTLILLFASFFPAALTRQSFLYTLFLAGFQIKGVALDLLYDVFLLHLALEATQSILKRLTFLNPDFRQTSYTPKLVPNGPA